MATPAAPPALDAPARVASDPAWRLREAHWLLAAQRLDEAQAVLHGLAQDGQVPEGMRPALAHDLAYVALRQGDAARARDILAPWTASLPADAPLDASLQVLWLRVLHRSAALATACAWAAARWARDALAASAAGVASLVALDAHDFARCDAWSAHALARFPGQPEALVARASLALARGDAAAALARLDIALRQNPGDGRAWSALGFAQLLAHDVASARASFEQALHRMPSHIGTWHGAGWAAVVQGDLDAARRCFEAALALDRNVAESHGGLATVLAMQGRPAAARLSMERAMRLDRAGVAARYAQALLDGEAPDGGALRRLAAGWLGAMAAPMGGTVADLVFRDAAAGRSHGSAAESRESRAGDPE